jgi:hypothetical protein
MPCSFRWNLACADAYADLLWEKNTIRSLKNTAEVVLKIRGEYHYKICVDPWWFLGDQFRNHHNLAKWAMGSFGLQQPTHYRYHVYNIFLGFLDWASPTTSCLFYLLSSLPLISRSGSLHHYCRPSIFLHQLWCLGLGGPSGGAAPSILPPPDVELRLVRPNTWKWVGAWVCSLCLMRSHKYEKWLALPPACCCRRRRLHSSVSSSNVGSRSRCPGLLQIRSPIFFFVSSHSRSHSFLQI